MTIRIPGEWEPHECCWMAWAVHSEWNKAAANKIKRNLSEVVQTIARYEPVRLLASRGQGLREAQREFGACPNVTVIEAPVDDFWVRDIMPTFAVRGEEAAREVVAIDWNFNGWGGTADRPTATCRRSVGQGGEAHEVKGYDAPMELHDQRKLRIPQ